MKLFKLLLYIIMFIVLIKEVRLSPRVDKMIKSSSCSYPDLNFRINSIYGKYSIYRMDVYDSVHEHSDNHEHHFHWDLIADNLLLKRYIINNHHYIVHKTYPGYPDISEHYK